MLPAILGIPLLLGAFTPGCSQKAKKAKKLRFLKISKFNPDDNWKELRSKGNMKVRIDLKAKSPSGPKVLFIRDRHDSKLAQIVPKLAETVGKYQLKNWKLLEHLRPQHVFVENSSRDYPPEVLPREQEPGEFSKVKQTFSKGVPGNPDAFKWVYGIVYGAHLLYKINHPEVHLHKTFKPEDKAIVSKCGEVIDRTAIPIYPPLLGIDPNTHQEYDVVRMVPDLDHPDYKRFCGYERESRATIEIKNFLKTNPGAKIAIIYGVAHSFCDDFQREKLDAELISVWFEGMPVQLGHPIPKGCE